MRSVLPAACSSSVLSRLLCGFGSTHVVSRLGENSQGMLTSIGTGCASMNALAASVCSVGIAFAPVPSPSASSSPPPASPPPLSLVSARCSRLVPTLSVFPLSRRPLPPLPWELSALSPSAAAVAAAANSPAPIIPLVAVSAAAPLLPACVPPPPPLRMCAFGPPLLSPDRVRPLVLLRLVHRSGRAPPGAAVPVVSSAPHRTSIACSFPLAGCTPPLGSRPRPSVSHPPQPLPV